MLQLYLRAICARESNVALHRKKKKEGGDCWSIVLSFTWRCHMDDVWLGKFKEHNRQLKTFQLTLIFKFQGCAGVSRARKRDRDRQKEKAIDVKALRVV